jgi:hypothetical protein
MDDSLNPGKNEDPGRDWADFRHPDKKWVTGASSGSWLEMLLEHLHRCS